MVVVEVASVVSGVGPQRLKRVSTSGCWCCSIVVAGVGPDNAGLASVATLAVVAGVVPQRLKRIPIGGCCCCHSSLASYVICLPFVLLGVGDEGSGGDNA